MIGGEIFLNKYNKYLFVFILYIFLCLFFIKNWCEGDKKEEMYIIYS